MTFKDGTATLAQKALSSGRATYSLSSLKRGSHGLTASYGGDARNTPSISGAVNLTVQ